MKTISWTRQKLIWLWRFVPLGHSFYFYCVIVIPILMQLLPCHKCDEYIICWTGIRCFLHVASWQHVRYQSHTLLIEWATYHDMQSYIWNSYDMYPNIILTTSINHLVPVLHEKCHGGSASSMWESLTRQVTR